MAKKECTAAVSVSELRAAYEEECAVPVSVDELAAVYDRVSEVHDLALQLSSLLELFDEVENPPLWVLVLAPQIKRLSDLADVATHTHVGRLFERLRGPGLVRAN